MEKLAMTTEKLASDEQHDLVLDNLAKAWNNFIDLHNISINAAYTNQGTHADNLNDFRKAINDAQRIIYTMKHGPKSIYIKQKG